VPVRRGGRALQLLARAAASNQRKLATTKFLVFKINAIPFIFIFRSYA
jgi:hypothetical protein